MSTKKEIWRLLEPGVDVWQEGDEFCADAGNWVPSVMQGSIVLKTQCVGRRRMTVPEPQGVSGLCYGWQEVRPNSPSAEDANTQGEVLWLLKETMGKVAANWNSVSYRSGSSYWMMLPNDPEIQKDPDEEAWENFISAAGASGVKQAFMAGRHSVVTDGGSHA